MYFNIPFTTFNSTQFDIVKKHNEKTPNKQNEKKPTNQTNKNQK